MASIVNDATYAPDSDRLIARPSQRLLCFVTGVALLLLSVGGRWDISLAAWIAPVLLLRFSRSSGVPLAIAGIFAATCLQMTVYTFETAVPFDPLTILLLLVLGGIFSMPIVLDRLFASRLGAVGRVILLPVATVLTEFAAASLLPIGASIGTRAITQSEQLPLMQIVSLAGPYAIGFLIAGAATVANQIWEEPSGATLRRYGGSFAALLLAVLAFGEARLTTAVVPGPAATVKVAALLPSMAVREPARANLSMAGYPASPQTLAAVATPAARAVYAKAQDELIAGTRAAARSGAKIIVWSETAAPIDAGDKGPFLARIAAVARAERIYVNVTVGVPYLRNETYLISPEGRPLWHYRKNHPVPGLEPVAPFANSAPVADTAFGRLTNLICYDADFPALARIGADIMLLPGWDWPEEGYMHTMRIARLRSIENGYAMVRADYNGLSGAFDGYGRVLATQDTLAGLAHVMIVDVPTRGVTTLYGKTGDLFAWLCVLATFGLCLVGMMSPVGGGTRAASV